jgi:histidine kinase
MILEASQKKGFPFNLKPPRHSVITKLIASIALLLFVSIAALVSADFTRKTVVLAAWVFFLSSSIAIALVFRFVKMPIQKLIGETRMLSAGNYSPPVAVPGEDELGQLGGAIHQMCREIEGKQAELRRQRDEYQSLFELVPCIITVQNRDLRLASYNREFVEKFNPEPGDYCFRAYKGRSSICEDCPVVKTFEDGKSHYGEETGFSKDGSLTYWIARTSPIRNGNGEIAAVMEVCLDITHLKLLEEQLEKSEKKYYAFFYNIPDPVFVLDVETLRILDCNECVQLVYGYRKEDIVDTFFPDLFPEEERSEHAALLKKSSEMDRVRQTARDGRTLFANLRISPSEYPGQKVYLVTSSDITKRLEAEQQLNQASKMATLGEMATGVAHELNQPLSVIKTASTFFIRKIQKQEPIEEKTLHTMLTKIDGNVDRAAKIITHMRQFARKSEMVFVKVRVNTVLEKAFDIFSQQLKVRGIEVERDLEDHLPDVVGDPDRLEQVIINMLINARDAIEEKWEGKEAERDEKIISLKTRHGEGFVRIEIRDTGIGIPKAVVEKIFEPFFTTKEVGKGTGLGLSISYGIIKDHGGEIRVTSEPGKGASFVITLPTWKNDDNDRIE